MVLHKYFNFILALSSLSAYVGTNGMKQNKPKKVWKNLTALVASDQSPQQLKTLILKKMMIKKDLYEGCTKWVLADHDLHVTPLAYRDYNKGQEISAWAFIQYIKVQIDDQGLSKPIQTAILTLDSILKETLAQLDESHENIKFIVDSKTFGVYYTPFISQEGYPFITESSYIKKQKPELEKLKSYLACYKEKSNEELGGWFVGSMIKSSFSKGHLTVSNLLHKLKRRDDFKKLLAVFKEASEQLKSLQQHKGKLPEGDQTWNTDEDYKVASNFMKTEMMEHPETFNKKTEAFIEAFKKRINKNFTLPFTKDVSLNTTLNHIDFDKLKEQYYKEEEERKKEIAELEKKKKENNDKFNEWMETFKKELNEELKSVDFDEELPDGLDDYMFWRQNAPFAQKYVAVFILLCEQDREIEDNDLEDDDDELNDVKQKINEVATTHWLDKQFYIPLKKKFDNHDFLLLSLLFSFDPDLKDIQVRDFLSRLGGSTDAITALINDKREKEKIKDFLEKSGSLTMLEIASDLYNAFGRIPEITEISKNPKPEKWWYTKWIINKLIENNKFDKDVSLNTIANLLCSMDFNKLRTKYYEEEKKRIDDEIVKFEEKEKENNTTIAKLKKENAKSTKELEKKTQKVNEQEEKITYKQDDIERKKEESNTHKRNIKNLNKGLGGHNQDLIKNEALKSLADTKKDLALKGIIIIPLVSYIIYILWNNIKEQRNKEALNKKRRTALEKARKIKVGSILRKQKAMEKVMAQSMVEIAKQMLADNQPLKEISKYTGLSSEELEALASQSYESKVGS